MLKYFLNYLAHTKQQEMKKAIKADDVEAVEAFLQKGVSPHHIIGKSPLSLTVFSANIEMMDLLLKYGANINEVAEYDTAFGWLCSQITKKAFADEDDAFDMLIFMLSKGADINKTEPITSPVFYGHLRLTKFLIARGAKIDNLWNYAWYRYKMPILKVLIEQSTNVPQEAIEYWNDLRNERTVKSNHRKERISCCFKKNKIFKSVKQEKR